MLRNAIPDLYFGEGSGVKRRPLLMDVKISLLFSILMVDFIALEKISQKNLLEIDFFGVCYHKGLSDWLSGVGIYEINIVIS